MKDTDRREFLKGTAWMGAAALAAGTFAGKAFGETGGGSDSTPMSNFACAPIPLIHIAFIGIGNRGSAAVKRVARIPGCEITVLCDLRKEAVAENQKWLIKNGLKKAKRYYAGFDESYKRACDDSEVDVVYLAVPANLHAQMALYAMRAGKHVLVEVPAAYTLDDLWELVETSEKTKRHCMMLENCCYGEEEMLAWNLCHAGVLGTLTHAEGAYIHNLTERRYENHFRNRNRKGNLRPKSRGNGYPTHPLGPICQYMDINRGDRLETIVSMSCSITGVSEYVQKAFKPGDWQREIDFSDMGDMNTSIIKTAKGRTIMLQYDTSTPRPYSRINMVQGSMGCFLGYGFPARLALSRGLPATHVKDWLSPEEFNAYKEKYRHPLWRTAGEIAKKVGGHGGMDFIMDLRWAYCLQNGLPLDMDVYDLATWSAVGPCSYRSDNEGGSPIEIPDFTRGAWRTAAPKIIGDIDLKKMQFKDLGIKGGFGGQLEV